MHLDRNKVKCSNNILFSSALNLLSYFMHQVRVYDDVNGESVAFQITRCRRYCCFPCSLTSRSFSFYCTLLEIVQSTRHCVLCQADL